MTHDEAETGRYQVPLETYQVREREKAPGSGGLRLDQGQHLALDPVALPPAVEHQRP
jgi:hypothetical protein